MIFLMLQIKIQYYPQELINHNVDLILLVGYKIIINIQMD